MTDPQYQLHLKALGKIARLWDDGGLDTASLKLLASRLFDQIATGETVSYEGVIVVSTYAPSLNNAINGGQNPVRSTAQIMAEQYLIQVLTIDLTTQPVGTDAKSVLEALQTEMSVGVDGKTLTDKSTTGFVNFFDTLWSPSGTWNTEADVTADYKDSIFVVTTIV